MEAAEIHSMGLEYLTHPHMGLLVGEAAADRYRAMHLVSALSFLPYGVCVDHFQHEVYANPGATPAERHAMWQRLEKFYMPWTVTATWPIRRRAAAGRPSSTSQLFFYIDYTLALACAAVLGVVAARSEGGARAYVALCGRVGRCRSGLRPRRA